MKNCCLAQQADDQKRRVLKKQRHLLCCFPPPTQVLRLANNSLTGSIPVSATTAHTLFMLDLHSNKLGGNIPENWAAPALQMLMLEDNHLTGGSRGQV